ncbi:MAG TPA: S41 family peptidase [Candidatus Omnitrophota bacterium]|nr:S41 family peptidase [Candidatus Omnitrophota bacterium]
MGKKLLVAVTALVIVLSLTTLAISQIDRKTKDDLFSQIELYSYTLTTIQADYVDELEPKDLIYGSLKGMLASLDPHSQFLDQEEYKELKTETQGKFGGLGIEISIRDGLLTVITPIEDTPAWKAGIKAGDRIVKIEDELTKDITLSDAVKKLRGKPGTAVKITVLREDEFKILEFEVTREIIHIQDVKFTQILEDKIGFVRLAEFREDSAKDFKAALDDLKQQGADSLILDLRNNPGGLLNVAIKITELFLPEGQTIVSTKGRRLSQNTVTKSTNKTDVFDWPMVVLINEGSASGSEILAGALKDNKRAIILGMTSFGKGSVQSVIPLPDGSGLRLTTSKYFTPSGESIHGKGIEPDIVVDLFVPEETDEKKQEKDVTKVFDDVELKNTEDPEKLKKEKEEKEIKEKLLADNQVQSAISVIKGIRVYKDYNDRGAPAAQATPAAAESL